MVIDKNDLGLEQDETFNEVKGLDCNFTISIEPIGNDGKSLAGRLHTPLSDDIAEKIKKEIINRYDDELQI